MSAWSTSSSKYVPPTQRNKQVTKTYDKNIINNNGNSNTNKFNSKKEKTIELTNEFIEELFPSIGGNSDIMNSTTGKALPVISFASAIKKTQETNNKNSKNYKNSKNSKNNKNKKSKVFLTFLDKEKEIEEREKKEKEKEREAEQEEEKEEKEQDKVRPGWVLIRKHDGKIQYKYGKERINWYLEKSFIRETFKHDRLILKYKIAREQWDRNRENDYLGDLSPYYNEPTIKEKLDSVSRRKRYINVSGQKPVSGIDYDEYNDDSDSDNNSNSDSDNNSDNNSDEVNSSGRTNTDLEKVKTIKKLIPELLTE